MTNKEILSVLTSKRKVSAFARFLGMTPQGVYALLRSEKKQDNQFGNYMMFVEKEFRK